jgi:hypothetical protein
MRIATGTAYIIFPGEFLKVIIGSIFNHQFIVRFRTPDFHQRQHPAIQQMGIHIHHPHRISQKIIRLSQSPLFRLPPAEPKIRPSVFPCDLAILFRPSTATPVKRQVKAPFRQCRSKLGQYFQNVILRRLRQGEINLLSWQIVFHVLLDMAPRLSSRTLLGMYTAWKEPLPTRDVNPDGSGLAPATRRHLKKSTPSAIRPKAAKIGHHHTTGIKNKVCDSRKITSLPVFGSIKTRAFRFWK